MNKTGKPPYVSCIKINGKPILPPIITPDLRRQIKTYRQQAVKLELRLKNCKNLQKQLDEVLSIQCLSDRPISQLTFGDNSHIDALGISKSDAVEKYHDDFAFNSLNRSSESEKNCDKNCTTLSLEANLKRQSLDINQNNYARKDEPNKPRLIRSNSYTLDTPSPILLAHLQRHQQNETDLFSASEHNDQQNSSSEFCSINTVYQNEPPRKEVKKIEEVKSPTIEVYQTDISVQQITVNTQGDKSAAAEEKKATFFLKDPFDLADAECELMTVLKEIPDNYAEQIIELLQKQRSEQGDRLNRYDNFGIDNSNGTFEKTQDSADSNKMRRSSTFSMSPSQSIYYSMEDSDGLTVPNTPSIKLFDKEREQSGNVQNGFYERNLDMKNTKNLSISRELFPNSAIEDIRKEWAASVIGAHVRGYLTRRLLRTEKVQSLIETIKDALMCALDLHKSDNIDERDVELHRRLIQQVSAACYSFNDVFFDLPIPDQMQIISADRERKIEKAKRPQSAKSSKSLNSNRTPNLSRSSSKHRMTQSLTKV